jgi:hypothetical protein
MNLDPDFELSADMRLLELQRASLGLSAPTKTTWQSRNTSDAGMLETDEKLEVPRSAVLAVEATATPASGIIPGAVVTVTLSIANEGAVAARNVIAAVPVPGGAGYRQGSFVADGRALGEEYADRFLHDGFAIDEIAPGTRRTFVWKLGVRLGNGPLVIAPSVRSGAAAVVGARTLLVSRKDVALAAFAAEIERADPALYAPKPLIPVEIPVDELPIYELDDEEAIVYEAAQGALSTAAPAVEPVLRQAQDDTDAQDDNSLVPSVPSERSESKGQDDTVVAEPEDAIIVPAPELAVVPREAVVLYSRFDRATVSFFDATFNGSKSPTILSHCIFASALACATNADGEDTLGFKRHLAAQSQILHRVQLHERLGKKEPIAEYAGELLATLDGLTPTAVERATAIKDIVLLETELAEPTLAVLAKINEDRERWDFVKARQLTLALQAQRMISLGPDSAAGAALENALRIYAQTAMTTLQKLFVRLRLDRTTGVLFHNDTHLDATARSLIAAFRNALEQ